MEGKRPRGRPKLRWDDTLRSDLKTRKIGEEGDTDGKVSARPATQYRKPAAKGKRSENIIKTNVRFHCNTQLSQKRQTLEKTNSCLVNSIFKNVTCVNCCESKYFYIGRLCIPERSTII